MKLGVWECLIGALMALGVTVGGSAAWAGAPLAIYTFTGGADGGIPFGNLVADPAGNLYGVTGGGGASGRGVIFELSPPVQSGAWTQTVLYSFTGGADGGNPDAGLIRDAAGNLYGTTQVGGCPPNCGGLGFGTVFELAPPQSGSGAWTFTTLHRFQPKYGVQDGVGPGSRLTLDGAGNLFGTTVAGGVSVSCCGTVFELSPPASGVGPWSETLLHVFSSYAQGVFPRAGVTLDSAGNLYGATTQGGWVGKCCGVVFELSPTESGPWTETILHKFVERDGSYPFADLVLDASGNLYGATFEGAGNGSICSGGCGVAFELSPPAGGSGAWIERTIYRFPGAFPPSLATRPVAVLYQDGALYGANLNSQFQPQGGVFKLTPTGGKFWVIATTSFSGNEGVNPESLVTDPAVSGTSTFYGTAGGRPGNGTVFSWTP